MLKKSLFLAALLLSASAHSAIVSSTLADYNSPLATSGFPIDRGVIGTFNFVLPSNVTISSATFSGTYGTAQFSTSTAGFDVEIEGDTITVCVPNAPGCYLGGASFRPFSFALDLSTFSGLLDGSADLGLIQTSSAFVRLGTPTLTIEYTANPVPEPGGLALAAVALLAVGAAGRRPGKR